MLPRSLFDRHVIHRLRLASVIAGVPAIMLLGGPALQGSSARLAAPSVADPSAQHFEGALLDADCSFKAELRVANPPRLMEGGMVVAEAHTKECLLKPQCEKSGFGIYTRDNKFYTFDKAGNRKAVALLRASRKNDDLEIEVTGQVQGDTIKVESLKFE